MSRLDLKPCPFCGGKARIIVSDVEFISYYAVACDNLDCHVEPFTDSFASKKEAIETWNRRADNEQND